MQNNLSSILVHEFKYPKIYKNGYKKCNKVDCKTCIFSNNRKFIQLNNSFILPLFDNTNCNSINSIYIIFCSFCCAFYIGQTNNIKNRIYNHIYSIRTFKPYENSKSVGTHFNLKGHNYKTHFSFFIFKDNIEILEDRLYIEAIILYLFENLNVKLFNDYILGLKDYHWCIIAKQILKS